jgi:peptidyl-prolyl cis-trans isomerase C
MKLRIYFAVSVVVLFLVPVFSTSVCFGVELARVGEEVITSEEFLESFRLSSYDKLPPERTQEGKREFLDRLVSKHLLSQYFSSIGWDTMRIWDELLVNQYAESIYIQALYQDAIPEVKEPWTSDAQTLAKLGKQFADSLVSAYELWVSEEAVTLLAEKSIVPMKEAQDREEEEHGEKEHAAESHKHEDEPKDTRPVFSWSELFTDEEKKVVAATFLNGALTVGDFAEGVDHMPAMVRPTGGNSEQIAVTVQHFGQQEIVRSEFEKRNLGQQAWFRARVKNRREAVMGSELFGMLTDSSRVTEEEARAYYEDHRDYYWTVPLISAAAIFVESEEVARRIEKKILEGEEFESVAVDFSVYSSSETGYDTTGFFRKDLYPALYDAIWDKEIGTVSGAVEHQGAWVVGKLLARYDSRLLSFEEAVPRVASRLKQLKANEALANLLQELKTDFGVEVYEEALEALVLPEW